MRKLFKTTPSKEYELTSSPVFSATVVEVDTETYTMRVRSKYLSGISKPLDIPALFFNVRDPSGAIVGAIPERGCEVWLCKVADAEDEYVPLAYRGIVDDTGYKGSRPDVEPGDVVLSTADGNFIHVSKGGSVSISSSPTCSMLLSPTDDTLYTMSSGVKEYSLSHSFETFADEGRRVSTLYKYYEVAEQQDPSIELLLGNTGSNYIYSLSVNAYNTDKNVSVLIGRDGYTKFTGHVTDIIATDFTHTTDNSTITNDRLQINSKQLGVNMSVGEEDDLDASIYVNCEDAHIEPSLVTVGVKESSDFLLKSTTLEADLSSLCTALNLFTASLPIQAMATDPSMANALLQITSSTQSILSKVQSGVYRTNKLKSE